MNYLKDISFFTLILSVALNAANPEWFTFPIGSNYVTSLENTEDYVWIGSGYGLIQFDKKTEKMRSFTMNNIPIPSNSITAIYVDTNKNLWIGMHNGAAYYDIEHDLWKVYSRQELKIDRLDRSISAITVDHTSKLWMSTYDSEEFLTFSNNEWKKYSNLSSLAISRVSCLVPDWNNNMIAGTDVGIVHLDTLQSKKDSLFPNRWIHSIVKDTLNRLWIAGDGLKSYDGKSVVSYDTLDSCFITVFDLKFSPKNKLYIGAYGGLVKYFDGQWEICDTNNHKDKNYFIIKVEPDKEDSNVIWLGTSDSGLVRFDEKLKTKKSYDIRTNPLQGFISFGLDKRGYCWVGQQKKNVVCFNGKNWLIFDTSNLKELEKYMPRIGGDSAVTLWSDSSCALLYSRDTSMYGGWRAYWLGRPGHGSFVKVDKNGNFWHARYYAGQGEGLLKFAGGKVFRYTTSNSNLPRNTISGLAIDDTGAVWMSIFPKKTDGYAYIGTFYNEKFTIHKSYQFPYACLSLEIDNKGNVWYVIIDVLHNGKYFGKGLYRFNDTSETNFSIYNSNLQSNSGGNLFYDTTTNLLWIGSNFDGVSTFDGGNEWKLYTTDNTRLPTNSIVDIEKDINGNMWFYTYYQGGLTMYRKGGVLLPDPTIPILDKKPMVHKHNKFPYIYNKKLLKFLIENQSAVSLKIYNVMGKKLFEIPKTIYTPGQHTIDLLELYPLLCNGVFVIVLKINSKSHKIQFIYGNNK